MTDVSIIILLTVAAALVLLLWLLIRKRRATRPRARLKASGDGFLYDILIDDGEEGEILIENILLCSRGIVLIDIKDVQGNVFGSDTMHEWTVITGKRRYAFANPQDALYNRMAAVKRILPDVPVEAHIAFTATAEFGKSSPRHVVMLDSLLAELETEFARQDGIADAYHQAWNDLEAAAKTAGIAELTQSA